jgi:hypothetical protein
MRLKLGIESGMSRRYAGLHFEDADPEGRSLGRRVVALSWNKTAGYIVGDGGTEYRPHACGKRP